MGKIMSKSGLAIILSGLKGFESPKLMQEQYSTDSEIAASVLWSAFLLGDINKKGVADLGCGTGILGIGALLLGAKKAVFIDSDKNALETAKNSISKLNSEGYMLGKAEFKCQDIEEVWEPNIGVVIQNPPFGTKKRNADTSFLEKALKMSPIVYSFHKSESKGFLERFSAGKGAKITHIWGFKFPLKASFLFHRRQIHRIDVSCFRFEKI